MLVKLPEAINVAAIAGIAAILSALGTAAFTYTTRTQELDTELVKVGISILRADPKETQTSGAREWAIKVIEVHSGQKFSEQAKAQLLQDKLGIETGWYDLGSVYTPSPTKNRPSQSK